MDLTSTLMLLRRFSGGREGEECVDVQHSRLKSAESCLTFPGYLVYCMSEHEIYLVLEELLGLKMHAIISMININSEKY